MLPEPELPADRSLARQLSGAFRLFGALVAGAFVVVASAYGVSRIWLTPEYEHSRRALTAQRMAFAAIVDEQSGSTSLSAQGSEDVADSALATASSQKRAATSATPALDEALVSARVAEQSWREQRAQATRDSLGEGAAQAAALQARFERYRRMQDQLAAALELRSQTLYERDQSLVALQLWLALLVFGAVFAVALQRRPWPSAGGHRAAASRDHPRRLSTHDGHRLSLRRRGVLRDLARDQRRGRNAVRRARAQAHRTALCDGRDGRNHGVVRRGKLLCGHAGAACARAGRRRGDVRVEAQRQKPRVAQYAATLRDGCHACVTETSTGGGAELRRAPRAVRSVVF